MVWRTTEQRLHEAEGKVARLNSQLRRKERSDDLRRKILVGSWLLSSSVGKTDAEKRLIAALDQYLTRNIDRALFGLPALPETPSVSSQTETEKKPAAAIQRHQRARRL